MVAKVKAFSTDRIAPFTGAGSSIVGIEGTRTSRASAMPNKRAPTAL
jgi:hypothetical protein